MSEEIALKKYYDPKTPASVFDLVSEQFKAKVSTYFEFLERDYGFQIELKGAYSDISYIARKNDLVIRVTLDKYLIEAYISIVGPTELKLLKSDLPVSAPIQVIEKCNNADFEYERAIWGESTYVENELFLFSSILKKVIERINNDSDLFDFMISLSDCPELKPKI